MKRKVITYRVPTDLTWNESLFQKDYADVLHIVATPTLFESLKEHLDDYWWLKSPIITIGSLLNEIFGENWVSAKAQLKQYLAISSTLNEMWEESTDLTERRIILSFIKNRNEVVYTLRTLSELRILSEFKATNEEEKIFKKLIEKIEAKFELKNWESIYIKDEMQLEYALIKYFEALQKESVLGMEEHNIREDNTDIKAIIKKSLSKNKLVLHGFYFITPIQEYLFRILENHFELVFVNLYDERFPGTFSIVEDFLGKDKVTWTSSYDEPYNINPLAANLLQGFEGDLENFNKLDFKAQKFTDISEFILYEKQLINEERPFSEHTITSRSGLAREHLYYAGILQKKNRNLLEYPIGRFLFTLHEINQEEKNLQSGESKSFIALSPEMVKKLFASGYVIHQDCKTNKNRNMQDYLKEFEMLMPYFNLGDGFREGRESHDLTLTEWMEKIDEIIQEKAAWDESYTAPSSRKHLLHSRLFEQLSYYKVSSKDLIVIKEGIGVLKKMSEELFGSGQEVEITEYIKKLKHYAEVSLDDDLIDEEKAVVEDLIHKINELGEENLSFRVADISAGLQFFLKSGLTKMGEDEEEQIQRIGGLFVGDGMLFKKQRNIHLAFADQKALPSVVKYKLWPIGEDAKNILCKERDELELFKKHSKHAGSMNRYLLYAMFASASRIRISFVEDLGTENHLKLASYFHLIGLEQEPKYPEKRDIQSVDLLDKVLPLDKSSWTDLMKEEDERCKKSSIFNYVLNDFGSYQEEFHQSHIYSGFLWAAHDQFKNWKKAFDAIEELFPQYSTEYKTLILNQLKEKKKGYGSPGYYDVDEYRYTKVLKSIRFLNHSDKEANKKNLIQKETLASPGYKCRYCAFINICREGVYSKDYEDTRT